MGGGSWCTVHSRHRLVGSSSLASVDRPELKDQKKKKKKRKVNTAGVCFLLERCVSARLRQLFTRLSQSCCCLEPLSCTVHVAVASLWCGGTWSLCSDFSVSLGVDWGKDVEPSSPFSDQNKKAFSCYLDKIMTNETHNEISNYHEGSSPVSWHFRAWVPGTTRISLSLKMSIGKVEN